MIDLEFQKFTSVRNLQTNSPDKFYLSYIFCGALKNTLFLTSILLKLQVVGLAKCTGEEFKTASKKIVGPF